jgi:hypothetical protein
MHSEKRALIAQGCIERKGFMTAAAAVTVTIEQCATSGAAQAEDGRQRKPLASSQPTDLQQKGRVAHPSVWCEWVHFPVRRDMLVHQHVFDLFPDSFLL